MNRSVSRVILAFVGMVALGTTATLAGPLPGTALAQTPRDGCTLPSEPEGIPAPLDAAISGHADKDRDCMKALLTPEAGLMFVSLGADGASTYRLETLDDWITRVKVLGHVVLEERQLKVHIERYGNIAGIWSSYTIKSDGKQAARGINRLTMRKFRIASALVVFAIIAAVAPTPSHAQPARTVQAALSNEAGTLSDKFTGLARVMTGKYEWKPDRPRYSWTS